MTAQPDLQFLHQFVPGTAPGITLLLLHGTGGNENDLLPIGEALAPGAAVLSPRGRVLENGLPRFFRRFAEGVFDVDDLKLQTHDLNDFVKAASERYGLKENKIVAVGYSNGANIAGSLLLLHPHLLSGAILFRAMAPFKPDFAPNLGRVQVLLGGGMRDSMIPAIRTEELAAVLASFGAEVETYRHEGGHELGQDDLEAARNWMQKFFAPHS